MPTELPYMQLQYYIPATDKTPCPIASKNVSKLLSNDILCLIWLYLSLLGSIVILNNSIFCFTNVSQPSNFGLFYFCYCFIFWLLFDFLICSVILIGRNTVLIISPSMIFRFSFSFCPTRCFCFVQ